MAIYDNNGSTNSEVKTLYDNDGTTSSQIGKVYDNNGTTSSLIYVNAATVTDLINFLNWSHDTYNTYPNTNSQAEMLMPSSDAYANGILIYSKSPGVGYVNDGRIYQTVNLVSGHKYYVAVGGSGYGGCTLVVNFPNYTGNYVVNQWDNLYLNNSAIWTSDVNGSYTVSFTATTYSDDTAYCRIWYATIVDLTAAFGSGSEPDVAWCDANIGRAFNGSKEIEL